jgi:LPS-assembly protein
VVRWGTEAQAARSVGRTELGRFCSSPVVRAVVILTSLVLVLLGPPPASAQDPSLAGSTSKAGSSFPKQPGGVTGPVQKLDQSQPLYLQGDELIYDSRGNSVTARGNVEIYYNNYILTADQVVYDQGANTLTAIGNVTLKEPNGNVVRAERYTLTDDFRDGFVQQLSVVARDDTRITADRANRRDGNVTEFQNGKFTPCKSDPGKPPLWCISATQIVHDQRAATITYQDAMFEVFGTPILYLPYFQHPDPSVKRKSGFLLPDMSSSNQLGFAIEVPYYFALAPSYDFTFHPMYTTKHGVLWQGDWRQKLRLGSITGQYDIKLSGIEDGDTRDFKDATGKVVPRDRDWSGSVQTRGRFSLSSWWNFGWDITAETDDAFRRFYRLDSILQTDRVNRVFLQGLSERNYFAVTGYQFGGLLLQDTSTSESRVHPVIDWNYIVGQPLPVVGGELSWNVNALSFSRSNGSLDRSQLSNINRVAADVRWRRRLTDYLGITYTPEFNLRGDAYQLSDVIDPVTKQEITDDTLTRGVASASILAAYPWVAHTSNGSHVIEPIGQIIGRTARVDQRRTPDEDARSLIFDDTNLFEIDKFSGWDRIETGTRANVGLQYTFQLNSGGHARVLAGQSLHLSGENAFRNPGTDADNKFVFNPSSGLQTDRSDYVLAAYLAPSSLFRFLGQTRFDQDTGALRRADALAAVNYGPFSLSGIYTYMAADPARGLTTDQQDIFANLGIRLTDNWSVGVSSHFDIDAGDRIQDIFRIKYSDECFVLTAEYSETFITNAARDIQEDRTVMLRFELKHLGEFKYKTDSLDYFFAENQTAK